MRSAWGGGVARLRAWGIIHARASQVLSRMLGQATLSLVAEESRRVAIVRPPSMHTHIPSGVARRCWRGRSRLIRAASGVKRKVIRPPCQIGDLNALSRAEVVIRYRLLPAAASCRGPASREVVQERRRVGVSCSRSYDTLRGGPNMPWLRGRAGRCVSN